MTVACGGASDRPGTQEVTGTTDYIVPGASVQATQAPCEHGTVVECKVWITEVDCFTGLAVCDRGKLTSCMDENAAEAALAELDETVAPLE